MSVDPWSVAVAFEAYMTDNNAYPPMLTPWPLTTPIAYMSALPTDAFSTDDLRQRVRRTFEYVAAEDTSNWRTHSFYLDYYAYYPPYIEVMPRLGSVPANLGKPQALW